MEEEKLEIKIDISIINNKCLLHFKEITECLTHIYYSINTMNESANAPLPTNSLPIIIDNHTIKPTVEEQKKITLNWIMVKAFEELINGLTQSLKETYKYLMIYSLSQLSKYTKTKEEIEAEIKKIYKASEKEHFPALIKKIEEILKYPLFLKEEILTINQVRNCFVHRNGFVSFKDINPSTNDLRLKWNSLKFYTIIDGHKKEITYEYRKDGVIVSNLSMEEIKNEKIFKLNDKILIDLEEFNNISYSCILFIQELYKSMPLP